MYSRPSLEKYPFGIDVYACRGVGPDLFVRKRRPDYMSHQIFPQFFERRRPGHILAVDYCGGVEPDRNKEDARSHRALGIDHGHRVLSQKLPYEGVTYLIA